jgi:hypothetical protein
MPAWLPWCEEPIYPELFRQLVFESSGTATSAWLSFIQVPHNLFRMGRLLWLSAITLVACTCGSTRAQTSGQQQVAAYTVPPGFPTSLFPAYYIPPSATQQPQPIIYDEVLGFSYPLDLTDPATIPQIDEDPVYYPEPIGVYDNGTAMIAQASLQLKAILSGQGSNCTKCVAALKVGQFVAQRVPKMVPEALIALCKQTKFMSNDECEVEYTASDFGAIWTQVLALANMDEDGHAICNRLSSNFCPRPYTMPSDTSGLFGPKPENITIPQRSGELVKVWHGSDFHIDPRYLIGSEANCTSDLCCRPQDNAKSENVSQPAAVSCANAQGMIILIIPSFTAHILATLLTI